MVAITGASAGVGRAIAHRFGKAGARIGLIARDATALKDVKDEVWSPQSEREKGKLCGTA